MSSTESPASLNGERGESGWYRERRSSLFWDERFLFYVCHCEDGVLPPEAISSRTREIASPHRPAFGAAKGGSQ